MRISENIKVALIGAGALLLSAFIAGYFTLFNEPEFETDVKGNENIISSDRVEGNKYVIQGDNIEGDKNIFNINEEVIKKIVRETLKSQEEELNAKYPFGHIGFGISKNRIIIPKGDMPADVRIDWSTAKILNETDQLVHAILPNMTIKNTPFWDQHIILKKKIGSMVKPQRVDNIRTIAEVIGIDKENDLLIIGVGFVIVTS